MNHRVFAYMDARWLTPVIFSSRNTQRRHELMIFLLTTIPSNVLCYANIPPYFVVERASLFTSKRYSDNELMMLMLMIVEIDAYPPTFSRLPARGFRLCVLYAPFWARAWDTQIDRQIFYMHPFQGWLGSRVVSVLDSGAEGPGSNLSHDAVG